MFGEQGANSCTHELAPTGEAHRELQRLRFQKKLGDLADV